MTEETYLLVGMGQRGFEHALVPSRACLPQCALSMLVLVLLTIGVEADDISESDSDSIEEVVVTSDPGSLTARSIQGSATTVDTESISLVRATHPHEIFSRVPGIWVVRGSGQEHLTGIRSGVLAGAGACGAFLLLEDNIPVRPVGFCNVNGLFELNTEQADSIEVLRGPSSAIFGGNALHGAINVRSFLSSDAPSRLSLDLGPYGYLHSRVDYHNGNSRIKFHSTNSNGYRESTGFAQHKASAQIVTSVGNWEANHTISATFLDQETGGYVLGFEAYNDSELRKSNPNPEAYRNASSLRMASHWIGSLANGSIYFGPYARRSTMEFLQHFLPGQPTEKNAQTSAGAVALWTKSLSQHTYSFGAQLEWMDANLLEQQQNPTQGSAFLVETRPQGIHYNYDIASSAMAVFGNVNYSVGARNELIGSMRLERVQYDYDNQHLDGNTRDDGSLCGFGGCLYTRPADRKDAYSNLASRIGYQRFLDDQTLAWAIIGLGYRPPQTTELYRLQSGQSVADLKSERLRSVEAGMETRQQDYLLRIAAYWETNVDLIFRDAEGLNVSDGEILARGVEGEIEWQLNSSHKFAASGTLTKHEYAFTRTVARGERIASGAEVDSAPSLVAGIRWMYQPVETSVVEFELNHIGSHYLNAANTAKYDGHTLLHFRANWQFQANWLVSMRVTNALNAKYADRADYAFGNYRYFPGRPRQFFAGIEYSW